MPIEAEEGTYSAISIMNKECGHFQKEFHGVGTRGITPFLPLFFFPVYLAPDCSKGRRKYPSCSMVKILYKATSISNVSHGKQRRYLLLSQHRKLQIL